MTANISITETWDRTTWGNWAALAPVTTNAIMGETPGLGYAYGVSTQNHIDIATFLESGWSGLTAGYVSSINHWPGGIVSATSGTHTAEVTLPESIDITAVGSSGFLTLALPNFPASDITLANSFIDLIDENAAVCSLAWSTSAVAPVAGNTTLAFPFSDITGIDATSVTQVRFRINASTSCTVYLMALRLISQTWVPSGVDFDNVNDQLRSCIPLDGDPAYVVPGNQLLPTIYRSADVSGVDDPQPIDAQIGVIINTGSQTKNNSFTLYVRQTDAAWITQANLQGVPQSALAGLPQPDTTTGTSWQACTVQWGPSPNVALFNSIAPTGGYTYTGSQAPSFTAHQQYFALITFRGATARLQIYPFGSGSSAGFLETPIFDTLVINDPSTFVRQAGRIGFQSLLQDGDTYIQEIRPNSLMFAEYQSAPMASITPVWAARLYAQFTPDTSLVTNDTWDTVANTDDNAPTITLDQTRYYIGDQDQMSQRVMIANPNGGAQGIVSPPLSPIDDAISGVTDWSNVTINLALWYPDVDTPLTAELVNSEGSTLPLTMPLVTPGQWQLIALTLPVNLMPIPAGLYTLQLMYDGDVPIEWWLDDVTITQHALTWSGRSLVSDPWNSNYAPWTPFGSLYNSDTKAARFTTVGNELQIRAQALRQDAAIFGSFTAVPIYGQLGNLVWPDQAPPASDPPIANIVTTTISSGPPDYTFKFNGLGSTGTNPIVNYQWTFGDGGYANQSVVEHTFIPMVTPTTYVVTLSVTDVNGNVGSTTTIVDV